MSEWNRHRRDDEQRRYGSEDRDQRNFGQGDFDRHYGESHDREGRSFGDGGRDGRFSQSSRAYGEGGYDQRGYGGYGESQRSADASYGQGYSQAWNRDGRSSAAYGDNDRGESYRPGGAPYAQGLRQDAGRRELGGQTGYRGEDYGRRDFDDRDNRQGNGGGGLFGGDRKLQQITDGDHDHHAFTDYGEHRGRGPKNYTRSDDRIRDDVNDRLSDDSWLDASDVEVQVKDGEVTLSGTVHSRRDKRRAEDVAEQVSAVKHVQNNLRVQHQEQTQAATARSTAAASTATATPYSSGRA